MALSRSSLWRDCHAAKDSQVTWQPLMRSGKQPVWRAELTIEGKHQFDVVIKCIGDQSQGGFATAINNQRLAEKQGLAPEVVECEENASIVISNYTGGGTVKSEQCADINILAPILAALKQLHGLKTDFKYRHHYLKSVQDRQEQALSSMKPNTREKLEPVRRDAEASIAALQRHPVRLCPCHSDMVTHNILLTKDLGVRFIDWDVSGMGDPHEELATLLWSASLDAAKIEAATQLYFASPAPIAKARVQLFLMLIPYDWIMRYQIKAQNARHDTGDLTKLAARQRKHLVEASQQARSPVFVEALQYLSKF